MGQDSVREEIHVGRNIQTGSLCAKHLTYRGTELIHIFDSPTTSDLEGFAASIAGVSEMYSSVDLISKGLDSVAKPHEDASYFDPLTASEIDYISSEIRKAGVRVNLH